MPSSKKSVPASVVRAWARENLDVSEHACLNPNARGRISPAVQTAFNKANRSKSYTTGNPSVVSVQVKTQDSRGRNISKSVDVPANRLRALSGSDKTTGRLTRSQYETAGLAFLAEQG